MTIPTSQLCKDLAAEEAVLDSVVEPLTGPDWEIPTPAEGWSIRDQISHLANGADDAYLALTDPRRFQASATGSMADRERMFLAKGRSMAGAAVLQWWRASRAKVQRACVSLDPSTRVAWYGSSMSVRSFLSARIMETWAHGQDVVDALGLDRPATARLFHIANLGVLARPWNYKSRGLTPPEAIRVELVSPSGDLWTWGEEATAERVRGSALEFCLVVTRRRHPADTGLQATGERAAQWLTIAQAYAGPPGTGRPPGRFKRKAAVAPRSVESF